MNWKQAGTQSTTHCSRRSLGAAVPATFTQLLICAGGVQWTIRTQQRCGAESGPLSLLIRLLCVLHLQGKPDVRVVTHSALLCTSFQLQLRLLCAQLRRNGLKLVHMALHYIVPPSHLQLSRFKLASYTDISAFVCLRSYVAKGWPFRQAGSQS